MTGLFITIEGPDGAGKSSQATLLAEHIRSLGKTVVLTREPGGTRVGEGVRHVLLDLEGEGHTAVSDALLYNAARHHSVIEVIRPALERGDIVISDRYVDSTLAYQGYGSGAPLDELHAIQRLTTGGLMPARTVLIDVSVADGLSRRHSGPTEGLNRFETSSLHGTDFHQRVRDGYIQMASDDPDRWRVIDGAGDLNEVAARVWAAVEDLL
ncbi:MAG TPA: dTMP kinase [Candidatus Limnocylindria bacterium]|nr:dTMP kinase [Candidatus Limnocylindria bacterium]